MPNLNISPFSYSFHPLSERLSFIYSLMTLLQRHLPCARPEKQRTPNSAERQRSSIFYNVDSTSLSSMNSFTWAPFIHDDDHRSEVFIYFVYSVHHVGRIHILPFHAHAKGRRPFGMSLVSNLISSWTTYIRVYIITRYPFAQSHVSVYGLVHITVGKALQQITSGSSSNMNLNPSVGFLLLLSYSASSLLVLGFCPVDGVSH